ncbi:MAG: VOC family protein [Lachnospiraceae bacterium]|nr:VOC family protein [Lachnospiraceae bacterium]
MNYEELVERSKGRYFDRITVLTKDIFQEVANLADILNAAPCNLRMVSDRTDGGLTRCGQEISYEQRQASFYFSNTEICVVQPVSGNTIYREYLDQYGEGICCVRERIPAAEYEAALKKYEEKGLKTAQVLENDQCRMAWFDIRNPLGILFSIVADDSVFPEKTVENASRIAQINITTPDVRKTIEQVTELLEIGPWEVGCQNKRTVTNSGFLADGELRDVEFEFYVAILVCGNIEWEAIQPFKGPLVYNDFLARRGIGYHHILMEAPESDWEKVESEYQSKGIQMSYKGQVGPVQWCYMDTESRIHFFMELRTDAVMDQLPDGYLCYMYPEQE